MAKKLIALTLAIVMVTFAITGCTSASTSATSAPATNAPATSAPATEASATTAATTAAAPPEGAYTLPLGDGSQTIYILSSECYSPTKSFSEILPIYQKPLQDMGLKLKWETVAGADYDAKVSVRLAAGGADLPDVVRLPYSDPAQWTTYIEAGTFIDLTSLLKEAPNITRLYYDYRPDIRKSVTWTDGKIYVLPTQVMGIEEGKSANDFANPPAWEVRGDILDKYGLKTPTTIDEMHIVLQTVKEKEPTMIPWGQDDFASYASYLAMSWGLNLWDGFANDGTGKITYQWTEPKMKDVLTTVNKWYGEGLLDKEPVAGTDGTWGKKAVSGSLFMTYANTGYAFVINGELVKNVPGSGFHIFTVPLVGDNKPYVAGYGFWNDAWGITSACKDPDLVIKFMDYMFYTDRAFKDQMYGVEGVDYTIGADGMPQATDAFNEKAKADGNYVYATGAYADVIMPQVYIKEYRLASYKNFMAGLKYGDINIKVAAEIGNSLSTPFPKLLVTPDESSVMKQYMTDITTYQTEMIAKFIKGEAPLSDFDTFVSKIKSMGIDEVIKVKQAQFDRYNAG